ncbi:hypothetical protein BDW68DRAFT_183394 [Aspergillus falconensis]
MGFDAVAAALTDASSYEKALDGAIMILGVTDLWPILQNPESMADKKPNKDNGITGLEKDICIYMRPNGSCTIPESRLQQHPQPLQQNVLFAQELGCDGAKVVF